MATINLFGASGHAKVVMDIIRAQGDDVGALYDDDPHCTEIYNKPVLRASEVGFASPYIISIGSNKARKHISERYQMRYAKAIHPNAQISEAATVGDGSVIMQGAIIQADAQIGRHCIINTGATVDHECRIGDFVHVSPHATLCGNVHIGDGAWIGAGATIIPGVKIGKWSTVGAGSVVLRDIPDGAVAYGNPCKIQYKEMNLVDNQHIGGGKTTCPLHVGCMKHSILCSRIYL